MRRNHSSLLPFRLPRQCPPRACRHSARLPSRTTASRCAPAGVRQSLVRSLRCVSESRARLRVGWLTPPKGRPLLEHAHLARLARPAPVEPSNPKYRPALCAGETERTCGALSREDMRGSNLLRLRVQAGLVTGTCLPNSESRVAGSRNDDVFTMHPADAADIVRMPPQGTSAFKTVFKVPQLDTHIR